MEKTKFIESEDGNSFEARCTFKRSFAAGAMREITFGEDLQWMGGFNIYRKPTFVFRSIYGKSFESDKRNAPVVIKADSLLGHALWLSVSFTACFFSFIF